MQEDTIPDSGESQPGLAQVSESKTRWPWGLGIAGAVVGAVVIYNLTVWLPVTTRLGDDSRNKGLGIAAYRTGLLHPSNITLDIRRADGVAPIDIFRALFQSAEALKEREFGKVTLSRGGKAVFVLEGEYFQDMGHAYAAGENPLYMMRTLPENLYEPDGSPAYGTWTGGWLGVFGRQMDDANDFAGDWVAGR